MKILVSITTTRHANWREKIKEAKKLGLTEVALFFTAIDPIERKELYSKLKTTKIKKVPFVHLRSDMTAGEVEFLIKNYGTKAFNIHSQKSFPLKYDLSKYKKMIYMENNLDPIIEEVGNWAGICLDTSHFEDKRLKKEKILFKDTQRVLGKYKVGVWHLNAISKNEIIYKKDGRYGYDCHFFKNLDEFDYCKRYKKYLPKHYIALELENNLMEQLQAKAYVAKLLR